MPDNNIYSRFTTLDNFVTANVTDASYDGGTTTLSVYYDIQNSTGADTAQFYIKDSLGVSTLINTLGAVPDGTGTFNIIGLIADGIYGLYITMVTDAVTSEDFNLTIVN